MMLLLHHYSDSYFCQFDTETGTVDPKSIQRTPGFEPDISYEEFLKVSDAMDEADKSVGYCTERPYGWVALYATNEGLTLQIDKRKWRITDDNVRLYYHDNFVSDEDEMMFGVIGPDGEFNIKYNRWWELEDKYYCDPIYASQNPDNEQNDIFAFIDILKNGDGSMQTALKGWLKNAAKPAL